MTAPTPSPGGAAAGELDGAGRALLASVAEIAAIPQSVPVWFTPVHTRYPSGVDEASRCHQCSESSQQGLDDLDV